MATTQPNPRASLLAGLRTGGVRSTSMSNFPHTAAPGASFNVPRFTSATHHHTTFPEEEDDEVSGIQDVFANTHSNHVPQPPMTSAVDGARFSHQQNPVHRSTSYTNLYNPSVTSQVQAQAYQMQLMQMEIIRLQAIQAQQYQAELLAQSQRQQQHQQQSNSQSNGWRGGSNPPATAGPYDVRFSIMNNQARGSQAEQLRSKLGLPHNDEPMTAALSGKFGSRKPGEEEGIDFPILPATPSRTTVISGGTVLGSPMSNNISGGSTAAASKSDSAVSWRRNGKSNSVLSGKRALSVISPTVKVTPPPEEITPSPSRSRPHPLHFNIAASQPLPVIAIDSSDIDGDDASSSSSSRSDGSPTTPSSNEIPLSPREEATKKLYEGLGIGRPAPAFVAVPQTPSFRFTCQPTRQPRGPPSGADELGPKNFATRIRRRAIGGLNVLLESRERRDVEIY